jgi:hypothetical protein
VVGVGAFVVVLEEDEVVEEHLFAGVVDPLDREAEQIIDRLRLDADAEEDHVGPGNGSDGNRPTRLDGAHSDPDDLGTQA